MAIHESETNHANEQSMFGWGRDALAEELQLALRLGQVEIRFQPQYSGKTGRLVSAEALTRWCHPTYGELGGEALFQLAGKAGVVAPFADRILELTLRTAKDWPQELALSLNISPRQLLAEGFVPNLKRMMEDNGINPSQVVLEITEEILIADLELGAQRLAELRRDGVRVALDDFGAGFCNFDYLKRLPLDAVKLDRSMVTGIESDQRDLAVLRAIVVLAKVLGLNVVAEGIETETQRDAAMGEGCDYWQGFLGSKPLVRAEFEALAAP
ncbi:MAG: EAL domain-containing protein [Sphingomonadales bacterium]|nr:MAG: EAL domain-containing protein [Sphingomonadales bacterium]